MSSHRLRILFLLPFAPRPEGRHGGASVTGQLISELAPRHDVRVLHLRERDEPPVDPELSDACDLVDSVPRTDDPRTVRSRLALRLSPLRGVPIWAAQVFEPAFASRAVAHAAEWRPDVIQVEYPVMGGYLPALRGCDAPRVLVDHDARGHGLQSWPGLLGGVTGALDRRAWRTFKRRLMGQVDAVVVFTERDRAALAELRATAPIEVIPIGVRVPSQPLSATGAAPPSVLFVGNFVHPPNVDAARWLAERLFPPVRADHPEARLVIVGPEPGPELEALAGNGVAVTGEVSDVGPYLDRAAVVAAPLRTGGGMRVKVLDALAAGKAVVATPLAVEGLDVTAGEELEVAADESGFRRAMLELLESEEARSARGRHAREWAERNLGWDRTVAAYEALYARLLEARR